MRVEAQRVVDRYWRSVLVVDPETNENGNDAVLTDRSRVWPGLQVDVPERRRLQLRVGLRVGLPRPLLLRRGARIVRRIDEAVVRRLVEVEAAVALEVADADLLFAEPLRQTPDSDVAIAVLVRVRGRDPVASMAEKPFAPRYDADRPTWVRYGSPGRSSASRRPTPHDCVRCPHVAGRAERVAGAGRPGRVKIWITPPIASEP